MLIITLFISSLLSYSPIDIQKTTYSSSIKIYNEHPQPTSFKKSLFYSNSSSQEKKIYSSLYSFLSIYSLELSKLCIKESPSFIQESTNNCIIQNLNSFKNNINIQNLLSSLNINQKHSSYSSNALNFIILDLSSKILQESYR
jgi:hypothetical protein